MFAKKIAVCLQLCAVCGLVPGLAVHAQSALVQPSPAIVEAVGAAPALQQLAVLTSRGEGDSPVALALREQVMERVLLASFDVDSMLGRIDAEAGHANNSRMVLEAQIARRNTMLNIATFAVSGALGTAGSAMQLTRNLSHAGNAVGVASGATALALSTVQLKGHGTVKRVLLSPYNMLAEVLGQTPNAESRYPTLVMAYLHSPTSQDGQLPDGAAPETSLAAAWHRLHLLQVGDGKEGASLTSVTTDSSQGKKLTVNELVDREAMLHDLHGAVSLLKVELRAILVSTQALPNVVPSAR